MENVIARELEVISGATANQHLLLDFTNVEQLNRIEHCTLINLHMRAEQRGGRLTLFNLRAQLFKLFTLTRLDTLLGNCRERVVDVPGLSDS